MGTFGGTDLKKSGKQREFPTQYTLITCAETKLQSAELFLIN